MKLDLVTAYAASLARVGSWAIVTRWVYLGHGPEWLATLLLARATLGILSFSSLGLAPVLIRHLTVPLKPLPVPATDRIEYASGPIDHDVLTPHRAYATASLLMAVVAIAGLLLLVAFTRFVPIGDAAGTPIDPTLLFFAVGLGVLFRTASDVPSAALQARGAVTTDNVCLILAEVIFVVLAASGKAHDAAYGFCFGNAFLLGLRVVLASGLFRPRWSDVRIAALGPLLAGGALVVLSQVADWLYAPLNQIVIERCISLTHVAAYAPAVQIDGALLLLVGGLSAVLLPRAAQAHADGDVRLLRTYYVRGTLVSLSLLLVAGAVVAIFREPLLRFWLEAPPPDTIRILPLILIHTVIGGTAGVGRSVLFGIGRIKAYTIAALIGGAANALLAVAFVTLTDLGLTGIVLATVITVTVRCAIWMPWYTLRALREDASRAAASS